MTINRDTNNPNNRAIAERISLSICLILNRVMKSILPRLISRIRFAFCSLRSIDSTGLASFLRITRQLTIAAVRAGITNVYRIRYGVYSYAGAGSEKYPKQSRICTPIPSLLKPSSPPIADDITDTRTGRVI